MSNKSERQLDMREILSFALVILLSVPFCIMLTSEGLSYAREREAEHLTLRANIFEDLVSNESWVVSSAEEGFDRNLTATVQLMSDSLGAFASNGEYTGPRVIGDGFVLSFQGDEPVIPEELGAMETDITRALVEDSVASGRMRTGRLTRTAKSRAVSPLSAPSADGADAAEAYSLSFGRIADGLYYVDMTPEAEYQAYLERYERINSDALERANRLFNGNTLLVGERNGRIELIKASGDISRAQSLQDLGITEDQVRQESKTLKVHGMSYECVYSHPETDWVDAENVTMIQMMPTVTLGMKSLNRALAIVCAMLLSFITILVFLYAVRRHVRDEALTRAQARRYTPRRLRGKMFNAALISAICVFGFALLLQGMSQIYVEAKYGQDTLDTVVKQMDQKKSTLESEDDLQRGEWYVYYGERMASLLALRPEFATREKLQSWCDLLNIDFIMLFDAEGQQTLCNRDYSGFTMSKGLGDNSADFRRLLLGIPSIVHETSTDATTGLERQMIGVTMPLPDGAHGALIMALAPDQFQRYDSSGDPNKQLKDMTMDGAECFIVNEPSRVVIYTSEIALQNAMILERGLSERSLRDGYLDFGAVDGVDCLILTQRSGESIFYYAVKCEALFRSVLRFGALAAGLYALVAAAILLIFFLGYTQAYYNRNAMVADVDGEDSRWDNPEESRDEEQAGTVRSKYSLAAQQRLKKKLEKSRTKDFWDRARESVEWDERTPERKASIVFRTGMILLLVIWGYLLVNTDLASKGYGSLARFLLYGEWERGANLFAVCSLAMIFDVAYLITIVSTLILNLVSSFLTGKGKTICKLALNAIKYLALFVTIYFALLNFGFPIGTVVGSIGIVSLALSLGAQDMAADIIAGLSIVFEKSFEVGDIVLIGSEKGTVQEIGVRSTKLLTGGNNIMTINNHSIDTIVNLTRKLSCYTLKVYVPLDAPIEEIEELLNRELPEIGKRCGGIVGELTYRGIEAFGDTPGYPCITLNIKAQCDEKELGTVKLFVNREVLLLFKQHGIQIA